MSAKPEKKTEGKKSYWHGTMGRLTVLLFFLVLLWNTVQIWMMSGVVSSVNRYNLGAVDEMGKVVGDVKEFASDLNDIRRFLLLPERQYGITGDGQQVDVSGAEDNSDNAVALFNFLDAVKKEDLVSMNRAAASPFWGAFLNRPDLYTKLQEANLVLGEQGDLQVKFLDNLAKLADGSDNGSFGLPLFSLVFSPEENLFRLQSVLGDENYSDYSAEDFPDRVFVYIKERAEDVRSKKAEEVLNAQQRADEAVQQSAEQAEQQKKELQKLVSDRAFLDTIAGMGLKTAELPRQELNKEIYDVLDQNGQVKFSLALEFSSGLIKLIKDNREIDLKTFLEDEGSKKKS